MQGLSARVDEQIQIQTEQISQVRTELDTLSKDANKRFELQAADSDAAIAAAAAAAAAALLAAEERMQETVTATVNNVTARMQGLAEEVGTRVGSLEQTVRQAILLSHA